MEVKLGETRRWMFGTTDPDTFEAADADSTPTAVVRKAGTSMGYSPTVTNKATGLYEVAVVMTSGNGFEEDEAYTLEVSATVNGYSGADGLAAWYMRLVSIDDLSAAVSTVGTAVGVVDDFLDTEIAAIKAKTDNLPSDPADASDIAASFSTVNTALSTIAGYIDTEVAAIKLVTDTLLADLASAHGAGSWEGGGGGTDTAVILGLLHQNSMVDKQVYVGTDLISWRLRTFADAAGLTAANKDALDDADGEVYRFLGEATYSSAGKADLFKITRDL